MFADEQNPQKNLPSAPKKRSGVGVIIFRQDGKVLLGKRKGSHGANTWAFPGGHPEEGETFVECAKREVLEETGLALEYLIEGFVTEDFFPAISTQYQTHFVIAKHTDGTPKIKEPNKCEEWCWVTWKELCGLHTELFEPLQSLLQQGVDVKQIKSLFYENMLKQTPFCAGKLLM